MINFITNHIQYNIHGIYIMGASLISLSVGLIVLLKNPKSSTHRAFFLISFMGFIWMSHYSLILLFVAESMAYTVFQFAYLYGVPFLSPCVYLFSIRWTKVRNRENIAKLGFIWALAMGLIMFFYRDQFCQFEYFWYGRFNVYKKTWVANSYFGILISLFSIYATMALKTIWVAYRQTQSPIEKIQYRNFIIGALIGYIAMIDFIITKGVPLYPAGYIFFSIYILTVAYTMIRYQFLEVKMTDQRIPLILLIYLVLFSVTTPILVSLLKTLNLPFINTFFTLLGMSVLLGIILSFGPFIYAFLVRRTFWLKGNLSKGFTHELKSPLSSIEGATAILIDKKTNDEADKTYLGIIEKNTNRLKKFVNDLLNVAKTTEGEITLQKTTVDFVGLIKEEIDQYTPWATQKEMQFAYSGPSSASVYVDVEKMRQVISNLFSNAVKFSTHGTIKVNLEKKGNGIQFSVQDNGPGIPNEDQERVFDRFFQGKNASKGSGLGLYLAKTWVEAHEGKIWAESEGEGKGTTISFTLPV